jgi:hypothetical protein
MAGTVLTEPHMKLIDWTNLYEEYKGLWVALSDDNETVVGSGTTAKEALDQARAKGFAHAAITHVPKELVSLPFVSPRMRPSSRISSRSGTSLSSISIAFGFGMGPLFSRRRGRTLHPGRNYALRPDRINRLRPAFGSHYAQL